MGERESTFLRLWLILFCFCLDRSCVHWRQNIECCVPKADDSTWCDIKSLAKLYSFDYELKVRLLPVWLWGSLLLFLLLQIASSHYCLLFLGVTLSTLLFSRVPSIFYSLICCQFNISNISHSDIHLESLWMVSFTEWKSLSLMTQVQSTFLS